MPSATASAIRTQNSRVWVTGGGRDGAPEVALMMKPMLGTGAARGITPAG